MFNFSTLVHNPQPQTLIFSPFPSSTPRKFQSFQPLKSPTNRNLYKILSSSYQNDNNDNDEEHIIGDCLVFEEGIFEDPIFPTSDNNLVNNKKPKPISKKKKQTVIKSENLVPGKWKEVQAGINITKKEQPKIAQEIEFNSKEERRKIAQEFEFNSKEERRKIAQEFEFNSNFMKKKSGLVHLRDIDSNEYKAYKEAKLAQLTPLVLDKVPSFCFAEKKKERELDELSDERVEARNPRWAVYGKGLEDVKEFLNSESYDPAAKKIGGLPFLFTWEERDSLKKKTPDLSVATSDKWIPLHTFAASGESFLLDTLLQHDVDINAMDKDGLSALYKAIIGRKLAITHLLVRNLANPFVQDNDGATLMHYAVQTASARAIKTLLFYNVDINLRDNDGWTPLHLAVQTQRPDIVELLLIKGADRTLKNKDGLTPLDLCLYSGQNVSTYELIKLLKQLPYIDTPERRVNQVVKTALNRHARRKWIRK
ncbi:ankyrin repeat domain-containing protein, chloroplastic isoform X1 [Medicago truncatula]|uniref:Ankyrin domain protein n=2 Tax=Medicago truncatula TaxID=3880 RepID=G7JYS4_MEDTR|nr:ankyrin repeat domain-containing protein, chloroplastic isoform X1 [Medicago truncatula]AES95221.2 ankyrin domain protein [Medicago truncatula]